MQWVKDWPRVQRHYEEWWQQKGMVCRLTAPLEKPREELPAPTLPEDLYQRWCDPEYRFRAAEYALSQAYFGGDAFPYFDTQIGPGSLALFVGGEPRFSDETVWYEPCIHDPEAHPPLRFNPDLPMFKVHCDVIKRGVEGARDRFLVGMPDIIEHFDILSALRNPQMLLYDLYDRPDWVKRSCADLNQAYFQAFDALHALLKDKDGGNAFSAFVIYGKGRTAKVQCDAAALLSPKQFEEFVVPYLRAQCAWLDNSIFHLDGTDCLRHLDHLLGIEELNAIQWTPQSRSDLPGTGDPHWFDLYRRILRAGKSVEIMGVSPKQVFPLLDALGSQGILMTVHVNSEEQARELEEKVENYR
jgi:hypothetical protein